MSNLGPWLERLYQELRRGRVGVILTAQLPGSGGFARLLHTIPNLSGSRALLFRSAIIIVLLALLRWFVLLLVRRRVHDVRSQYYWRKITAYVSAMLGLLLVGWVWLPQVGSLATFLGLLSAGVAVALRDPLVNMVAWFFILWRRPFMVGDRVQIGDFAGDVIDQRLFQFTLLEIGNWIDADQSTGRLVHMPNGQVFTTPLANYTRGFPYIWNELAVLVTFESDWEHAKQILLEVAQQHGVAMTEEARQHVLQASQQFMIFYSTLSPTVYTSVRDSGVMLTIRYICEVRKRRGSAQAMWEDILRRFAERDDIDFAYPTRRFYDNIREGKPEARAAPGGE
jgi:small-conductance mechanosensitive channel